MSKARVPLFFPFHVSCIFLDSLHRRFPYQPSRVFYIIYTLWLKWTSMPFSNCERPSISYNFNKVFLSFDSWLFDFPSNILFINNLFLVQVFTSSTISYFLSAVLPQVYFFWIFASTPLRTCLWISPISEIAQNSKHSEFLHVGGVVSWNKTQKVGGKVCAYQWSNISFSSVCRLIPNNV